MTIINIQIGTSGKIRSLIILVFILSFIMTCIDPFNPKLKGTTSILVVDALLTNENRSYSFKLSRTTQSQDSDPDMVIGAEVVVRDMNGSAIRLQEAEPGIYRTDSLRFLGEAGHSYMLYIKTSEGTEYESDTCFMNPVQPIDSIYFVKDQEISTDRSRILDGIRIFLDSKNSGGGKYFRWVYNEWWKFSVPYPKEFNYISENDIPAVDTVKRTCWAYHGSDEFILKSTVSSSNDRIERKPILFIGSAESDRLTIQYCIEVRQLSLSMTEFDFWNQLSQVNEGGGSIFDKQPFSIVSNIHNKNNPDELVLGYFQVSAAEQKRIYIIPDQLSSLNLPKFQYDCEKIVIGPSDYPMTQTTFDKIYYSYTNSGYVFTQPVYDRMMNLSKLTFTRPACALCTSRGSLTKPDFWIDIEPTGTKK